MSSLSKAIIIICISSKSSCIICTFTRIFSWLSFHHFLLATELEFRVSINYMYQHQQLTVSNHVTKSILLCPQEPSAAPCLCCMGQSIGWGIGHCLHVFSTIKHSLQLNMLFSRIRISLGRIYTEVCQVILVYNNFPNSHSLPLKLQLHLKFKFFQIFVQHDQIKSGSLLLLKFSV